MAQDLFLADDVEKIIVETDEENPTPIVTIDRSETPIKTDERVKGESHDAKDKSDNGSIRSWH